MTLEDFLTSPVAETDYHETFVDGLRVECNNCDYVDYAPSMEDAEVLKEIHEQHWNSFGSS